MKMYQVIFFTMYYLNAHKQMCIYTHLNCLFSMFPNNVAICILNFLFTDQGNGNGNCVGICFHLVAGNGYGSGDDSHEGKIESFNLLYRLLCN